LAGRIRVYADVREEASGIPRMLESMGLVVIREQLPLGDYILPGEVIVERKSSSDYANSLFDGRLFDQVSRMTEYYDTVVLVVEGGIAELRRYHDKLKQLYAALASLIAEYGVIVVNTGGPGDTAMFLEAFSRKLVESRGARVVIHKKPKLKSLREWQLYIVSSLPGIGPKLAEKLLESFKTIEAICTASVAELQRVVGERRADRIKEVLKAPYEPHSRRARSLEDFVG